ncbi:hypothetical protein Ddc_16658 [Ditylenchus destructor]|nr:hypothetical protein Ddc_16658 [Ditylenchus destructor]
MSCSKPMRPFNFDVLYYLNRDQLERFSIVCRSLKNFIARYFQSKPYRIFDELNIRAGMYVLRHNRVHWHPNRDDYSVQQFLAAEKCSSIDAWNYDWSGTYYSFAEMRPYLGPTVRIINTSIFVARGSNCDLEHIEEMESLTYLWRDGEIVIRNADEFDEGRINAGYFQPILNSPTVLQCRSLGMENAHFSFKDYKVLYAVKFLAIFYSGDEYIDFNYWQQFLEQTGAKPLVALYYLEPENIYMLFDQLSKSFSSAVSPNAFKIVFFRFYKHETLTELRETNNTTGEILELKEELPVEYQYENSEAYNHYTLERSNI